MSPTFRSRKRSYFGFKSVCQKPSNDWYEAYQIVLDLMEDRIVVIFLLYVPLHRCTVIVLIEGYISCQNIAWIEAVHKLHPVTGHIVKENTVYYISWLCDGVANLADLKWALNPIGYHKWRIWYAWTPQTDILWYKEQNHLYFENSLILYGFCHHEIIIAAW
jgi:hypothetical protein